MKLVPLQIKSPDELGPLGTVLSALSIGATLVDRALHIQWTNEYIRDVAHELTCNGQQHCFATFWKRSSRCADCLPLLVFRTGEPQEGIRERGQPGGRTEAYRVRAVPVLDPRGELAWVAESFVRLSALVPELGHSNNQESPEEAAGAGLVVVDQEDRIVAWSGASTAIFGYSLDEVLGRRVDLLIPPDRLSDKEVLRQRIAREGKVTRMETVRMAKDGRTVPVAISSVALRDEQGRIIGRKSILEDLSSLQQLRSRVRAQEQLLAHISQEAADAIVGANLEGTITSWNRGAEQVLGATAAQMLGKPLSSLAGEGPARSLLERVKREQAMRGVRMHWNALNGGPLPVEVSAALLQGPSGPDGVAVVARDMSAQLRLERQFVRSEKLAALGSLAAGLAHEIGTPLNVISATAEYLMLDQPEGAPREQLKGIVGETDRISRLVRELLTFARGSNQGRVKVSVAEAVERVLRLVRIPMERKRVQVSTEIGPELSVHAEPDGVHQLIMNLLLNAATAVSEGGSIRIEARAETVLGGEPSVALEVHDDGPGVPEPLRERIFDPFFTTRPDGTGLGLAVCAHVVSNHGGDIRVTTSPMGGACFVIHLPEGASGRTP
jgi:PAS domain S-box-containing protein